MLKSWIHGAVGDVYIFVRAMISLFTSVSSRLCYMKQATQIFLDSQQSLLWDFEVPVLLAFNQVHQSRSNLHAIRSEMIRYDSNTNLFRITLSLDSLFIYLEYYYDDNILATLHWAINYIKHFCAEFSRHEPYYHNGLARTRSTRILTSANSSSAQWLYYSNCIFKMKFRIVLNRVFTDTL